MRWISPGRAARDETAFRHALKTAHRLRAAGERMTDAAIIDAYERAYNIAQREGRVSKQASDSWRTRYGTPHRRVFR